MRWQGEDKGKGRKWGRCWAIWGLWWRHWCSSRPRSSNTSLTTFAAISKNTPTDWWSFSTLTSKSLSLNTAEIISCAMKSTPPSKPISTPIPPSKPRASRPTSPKTTIHWFSPLMIMRRLKTSLRESSCGGLQAPS